MADFVTPLEQVPDLGGGGVSAFIDPLAGGFIDPTVAATAPDLSTIANPVDPTLGLAVATGSPTGTPLDTSSAIYGIDPATGLPYTTFTATNLDQGVTVSDLQNLPLINQPTMPSYTPPIDTSGNVTSVNQLPVSVFDPSQLPNVSIPTTSYGGILPPVLPPAPPAPSLFSKIANAVKGALGGSSGASGGGAGAGTPKPGTPTQPPKLQQAGVIPAGGGNMLLWLLLIGGAVYLMTKD